MHQTFSTSSRRPIARQYSKQDVLVVKLGFLAFLLLLLAAPLLATSPISEGARATPMLNDGYMTPASNLIKVKLPYPVESIAVGTTPQGSGYAYVHGDTIRFKDPITLTNDSLVISGGYVFHNTLTGADLDGDGYTEFLFMQHNSTLLNLVVVDFDAGTVTGHFCDVIDPIEIVIGNFSDDGQTDVAVYNDHTVRIMDLTDGSELGVYNPFGRIKRACVGNFSASNQQEIAILYNTFDILSQPIANVTVIAGNGTRLGGVSSSAHVEGVDLASYAYDDELDHFAVTVMSLMGVKSFLASYHANMTLHYITPIPEYYDACYVKAGFFNEDTQEDLVVVPWMRYFLWVVDGSDGTLIGQSMEESTSLDFRGFATARLDSDTYSDITISGPRDQLTLIRGSTGETGYEEYRVPGPFRQVLTFDIDGDGREDMVALTDQISILLSDTTAPDVTLDPLYPSHPTIYDSYFKVELTATDDLPIDHATLFIRPTGGGPVTSFVGNEMIKAPNDKYLYITTDLTAGNYDYYIEVMDPYLNVYSYGNFTNPETLTVEDHFGDGYFYNATVDQGHRHVMAPGNTSMAEEILYFVTRETLKHTATLRAVATNGTNILEFEIHNVTYRESFEVYTGMQDGDTVLDPILAGYNDTHTRFWILHGSNRTSWKNATFTRPPANTYHPLKIFDDDEDGLDEIHFVAGNDTKTSIFRVESDLSSQTDVDLPENGLVVGMAYATISGTRPQLGILRENKMVDIIQAYNSTLLKTLDFVSPGGTVDDWPMDIFPYLNSSHLSEQFLVLYTAWSGDTPTNYLCFVDDQTVQVGDAPVYETSNNHIRMLVPHDLDDDGVQEIFIFKENGNLSLHDLAQPEPEQWSTYISDAIPLSTVVLDYDGDGADEFVIATSDDRLTAVSFEGEVDYRAVVGMTFNMVGVTSTDIGAGEEIAAFPILRARYSQATIRNINLLYVLNATFALESSITIQGSSLWANTTVWNVYDEPVYDASVSLVVEYEFGAGTAEQTMGLVYDDMMERYTTTIVPNWPIGLVNLTHSVNHQHYDSCTETHTNALRVESPLTVTLFVQPQVAQGEDLQVNVTVTDSIGGKVTDANVTIALDSTNYTTEYLGESYYRLVQSITLAPGSHPVLASADHPFATAAASDTASVSVLADDLTISGSVPELVNQDEYFTIWLNITDPFGNDITNATVALDFGTTEFTLSEIEPGRYLLNESASLPVGNYSCEILVSHTYVQNSRFDQFYLGVIGDLYPSVSVIGTAEAGSNFNISVFVYDIYSTVPEGLNITAEVSGVIYPAVQISAGEFRVTALANFSHGVNSFTIYVNATFGNARSDIYDVYVYSDAYMTIDSSLGWVVNQTDSTVLTVSLSDWIGSPVIGATVIAISPSSLAFQDNGDGTYSVTFDTVGYALGEHTVLVTAGHTYLHEGQTAHGLAVVGEADVALTSIPFPVQNKLNVTFNFTITDRYGNPISNFNYTLDFAGVYNKSGTSNSYRLSWTVDPSFTPGAYWLGMTLNGTHLQFSTFDFSIDVQGVVSARILAPTDEASFAQGNPIQFVVHVQDEIFSNITEADVDLVLYGSTIALVEASPGIYTVTVATISFPPGEYLAQITVSQSFMNTQQLAVSFSITGNAYIAVTTKPSTVLNNQNVTFEIIVTDQYGNPVNDFDYVISFGNQYNTSGSSTFYNQTWTFLPLLPPDSYTLNVTVSGPHIAQKTLTTVIPVKSDVMITMMSPTEGQLHVQGNDSVLFVVELKDMLGNAMNDSSVSVLIHESLFMLNDLHNGTYSYNVPTAGWAARTYNWTLMVSHTYFAQDTTVRGTVKILAELNFRIEFWPQEPQQGEQLNITVEATDKYGNLMLNLAITITFQNQTKDAVEIPNSGKYSVNFLVADQGFGVEDIVVEAHGATCIANQDEAAVNIVVAVPQLSLDAESFGYLAAISFLVSFLGMLVYFRISSGLSITRGTQEILIQGIRKLDYLYLGVVGMAGLTVLHSYLSAGAGDYGLAVAESILLLGISLILYGIWLYRDASSTIRSTQKIGKKRMILGLWHLIFVPIVIVQIFEWGKHIEWLEFYVLQNVFHFGEVAIPTIMLTIFAAYISSIVVVVLNLYREIGKGLMRIQEMAVLGTPPVVVEQECVDLVEKMSSSIRMKFFMFLVVLTGTTVLTMDFLRSYSLGVIVLMPVVFLVIVPFVSSRMAKGVSRVSTIMRGRHTREKSLSKIADEGAEIVPVIDEVSLDTLKIEPVEEAILESEPDVEPETEESKTRLKKRLTKRDLINLLPPEIKEAVGVEELGKLSKSALEALLPPVDEEL